MEQSRRRLNKAVDNVLKKTKDFTKGTGDLISRADRIMTRMARSAARTIIESKQKGVIGDVARSIMRGEGGTMQRAGREVIRRRASRAAAAAARGSKPAAKALSIYDRQLAPTLPGKPGKKASNAIKPGPRNTNPPKPKKARKPRTPKPPGSPKPKRKRTK